MTNSFEPVGNTTLGQIVRRHLDQHFIAGKNADAVLAHAAGGMGDDLMFVFELDPEGGVRKQLRHDTRELQELFLCHPLPSTSETGQADCAAPTARKLAESCPFD